MRAIPKDLLSDGTAATRILEVSDFFIAGEIELQQGRWQAAAELLEKGAAIEDTLSYGEPPQWLQPIRHTLGAVYLSSKRWADAERAYRKDLAKWPNNGWSLYGLYRALEQQGRTADAAEIKAQFEREWKRADRPIVTSCLCIPKT
jgi:tetratricopeptide (TPR) repeat protein